MSHTVLPINVFSSTFSYMVPSVTSVANRLILLNFESFEEEKMSFVVVENLNSARKKAEVTSKPCSLVSLSSA